MKKEIADLIKRYRKRRGMSQKELAQGICAQGIISRIERGEMVPSTDIFFGLIKKLEIDMKQVEEIFAIHSTNHDVYSKEIQELFYKRDHQTLLYIVSNFPVENFTPKELLYVDWYKAILDYHHFSNFEKSKKELEVLAESSKEYPELHLRVLNSLGNIYMGEEDYEQSMSYFLEILPNYKLLNQLEYEWSFLISISRCYFCLNDIEKALYYNTIAIESVLEHKSLYLFGELLLMQANIFKAQGLMEEALTTCKRSIVLFELENNRQLKNIALSLQSKLQKEVKNED